MVENSYLWDFLADFDHLPKMQGEVAIKTFIFHYLK